jgi:hypothetical protein
MGGQSRFFLSRKLSLQTPRLGVEFGKPLGAHEIAQRTRRAGLVLVDWRFCCRLLTWETSMNHETLCNPVPAADIPAQFLPGPEQQTIACCGVCRVGLPARRRRLGDAVALF